jgi:dephospho-CoA kinase
MIYNIYLNIIVKVFILGVYILTGSIGSGKSEAQILFEKFNVSCFCADKIVRSLYNNSEVILHMQNILPLCVTNGVINIELLRETIFHNEKKMFEVEEFIQPKVFKKFEEIVNSNKNKNTILVLPTIKNNPFEKKYKVIYITASQENRVKRLSTRKNYNMHLIKKIISYQDSIDIYKKNNDFFLDNNGSVKNLEHSVKKIVKLL